MRSRYASVSRSMFAACLPLAAGAALAQSVAPADAPDSQRVDVLEEIVVTAQKREERAMEVPISLTAFDSEQLAARNIFDLSKLSSYVPSVEVTPGPGGGASIIMRGVTTGVGGVGVDPSVGVYQDGVYVARDWVAMQSYLDVDRVEILRGPQGTLYGRNTTGGAYNIYHKRPKNELELGVSAEMSSYDGQRAEGVASGPLVGETVLGRIAVAKETQDDYGRNLHTGTRAIAADMLQGIATIEIHPSDSLAITLRADAMNDDGRVGSLYHRERNGTANAAAPLVDDPYQYNADFASDDNYLRNRGWSADLAWNFGDGYQFRSITGGRKLQINTEYDTDASELPIYTAVLNDQSRSVSQEFQLTSPTGDALEWIGGVHYYREKAHDLTTTGGPYQYGPFYLLTDTGAYLYSAASGSYLSLSIPFDYRGVFDQNNLTESYAAFGQLTYKFSEKFRTTFGLRYTDERREFDGTAGTHFLGLGSSGSYTYDPAAACREQIAAHPVSSPAGLTTEQAEAICVSNVNGYLSQYSNTSNVGRSVQELNFDNLSGRLALSWFPNENTHIFVSATSGFKSGGFNSYDTDAAYGGEQPGNPGVPVIAFEPPFGPEKVWSYEAGVKGRLAGNKLQYDLNYWFYNWNDIQAQVYNFTDRTSAITNDAKAKAQGIELALLVQPWHGGSVDLNAAWIDSEYTHFGSTIDDVVTGETAVDFTGTSLPGTPEWKVNLGLQHTLVLGAFGDLTLRGEFQHRSDSLWVYTKDPFASSGGYDIGNVRVTWRSSEARYSVGVYVENVTDQRYDYYRYGDSLNGVISIVAPPRIIGVRLGAKL